MNDNQLKAMTEADLRIRFNAAPDYLKTLLARKRALSEDTTLGVDLGKRAASRQNERNV